MAKFTAKKVSKIKVVVELISRLITPRLQWHGFLLVFAQLGGEGVVRTCVH